MTPETFFKKNNILEDQIMYIIREEDKTEIHLNSGAIVSSYIPVKRFYEALPSNTFISINRGIVANKNCIVSVDENEKYLMLDGVTLYGRMKAPAKKEKKQDFDLLLNQNLFDIMPYDCYVLEAGLDERRLIEWTIKYWNNQMSLDTGVVAKDTVGKKIEELGFPLSEVLNRLYSACLIEKEGRVIQTKIPILGKEMIVNMWSPRINTVMVVATNVERVKKSIWEK